MNAHIARATRALLLATLLSCLLSPAASDTFASATASSTTSEPLASAESATPDSLPQEDDFATVVLNDPWDMDQATDVYPSGLGNQPGHGFVQAQIANGVFSGVTETNDAWLWLMHHSFISVNNLDPHLGTVNPIAASKYRYAAFRLYRDDANANAPVRIYWSQAGAEATGVPCGISTALTPYAGWHVYRLDLAQAGSWAAGSCAWSGQITGLLLGPTATSDTSYKNHLVKLDWFRLIDPGTVTPTTISWNVGGSNDGERGVSLLLDNDDLPGNGVVDTIAANLRSRLAGTYTWGVKGVPPGAYRVHAVVAADYAGSVLGDPWDMQQGSDFRSVGNLDPGTIANGVMEGISTSRDPQIELRVDPGHPIDASLYKSLYVRLNASAASSVQVLWTHQGESYANNYSAFVPVTPGWHTVAFKLDQQTSAGSWSGAVTALRLDPGTAAGVTFQIDWVGLTPDVNVATESDLTPATLANVATVRINQAPLLRLSAPSMESGEDYAATVLGQPWDFDDGSAIVKTNEIAALGYSADRLTAVTTGPPDPNCRTGGCGDPQLNLRVGPEADKYINPNRFKYLTVKFAQDGVQDVGGGWCNRLVWSPTPVLTLPYEYSYSDDIITRDGWPSYGEADKWQTYQVDLTKLILDPEGHTSNWGWNDAHGWITQFQFHPNEVAGPTTVYLKRMLLTADPVADGRPFTIRWELQNPDDTATVWAYYYPAGNAGSKTLIGSVQQPASSLSWDTSGVADGKYYIYLEARDGANSTGRTSQVPVIVRRPPTISLSLPATARLLHGQEYAADVLGNPWDMQAADDISQDRPRHDISAPVFANGEMSFTTTGADPYFWFSSSPNSAITAGKYQSLYLRMWSGDYSQGQVYWQTSSGAMAHTDWFVTVPGWHVYRINLSDYAGWTGNVQGIRLDPATTANRQYRISWARLTDPTSAAYRITWSAARATNARVSLFVSQPGGEAAVPVVAGVDAGLQAATADLSWLQPGAYTFQAQIDNQVNPPVRSGSLGPLRIACQQAPRLQVEPANIGLSVDSRHPDASRTLTLDNCGVQDYTWTVASTKPWISVTPATGNHEPAQVTISAHWPGGSEPRLDVGSLNVVAPGVGSQAVSVGLIANARHVYLPVLTRP